MSLVLMPRIRLTMFRGLQDRVLKRRRTLRPIELPGDGQRTDKPRYFPPKLKKSTGGRMMTGSSGFGFFGVPAGLEPTIAGAA